MKPKRSTRMGPAIRHALRKLKGAGTASKVLMIVSDGFPQDCDYGPERGNHEYGLQDTAQALREAAKAGVETFCVTVDRSGNDYLKRMCPENRYMVIEETNELPSALQKAYRQLTMI
jgi:nitric oxide reductase NorD protein